MSITIRTAVKADCSRLLELIRELAVYEKAPDEVTVSLEEFENAGFGDNPVWKAFVAEENGIIQGFGLVLHPLLHLERMPNVSRRFTGD
jgi:hypothetical protein